MTKQEFVQGVVNDFNKGQVERKRLAKEEYEKCGVSMPNVEYLIDNYVDYKCIILKAEAKHSALWFFVNTDVCNEKALEKFAGEFYDSVMNGWLNK